MLLADHTKYPLAADTISPLAPTCLILFPANTAEPPIKAYPLAAERQIPLPWTAQVADDLVAQVLLGSRSKPGLHCWQELYWLYDMQLASAITHCALTREKPGLQPRMLPLMS
jgi:hypothetical protein